MSNFINKSKFITNIHRAYRRFDLANFFLHNLAQNTILDKLSDFTHNQKFEDALLYGLWPHHEHISGLANIEYADIVNQEVIGVKLDHIFDEESNPLLQAGNNENDQQNPSQKYDFISSSLTLQFCEDIVGALSQYRHLMKNGGVFISAILGGNTLKELRESMIATDQKLFQAAYPRVMPNIEVKQLGSLMQRADYKMVVSDSETITAEYSSLHSLLTDIKGMGFANCSNRDFDSIPFNKSYFKEIEKYYKARYATAAGDKLIATFDIIYATGEA